MPQPTMRAFTLALKAFALVFFAVSALHLAWGLNADAMLGAVVPPNVAAEPSLDSQNRFYGVAFSLYGAVLYLCATDISRFEPVLKVTLLCFFLGGVARLVSWATHGAPAPLVIALMVSELLLPPLILAWFTRVQSTALGLRKATKNRP